MDRAAGNRAEVLAVRLGEAAVALRQVGGHGQGGAVELVGQAAVPAWERLRQRGDLIGEIDRLLVDGQFLEGWGYSASCLNAGE
jgi:hypothetical protein